MTPHPRPLGRSVALVLLAAFGLLAGACSSDGGSTIGTTTSSHPATASTSPPLSGGLTVFAASSLTGAFTEAGKAFEAANPGVTVTFSFAGSSALAQQIVDGAPADVFASADAENVQPVIDAGLVEGTPAAFATNSLEIAVPKGNPAGVAGLDDFSNASLTLGLCAPEVPCGDLAHKALDAAGVTPSLDTEEPDVKSLLAKVSSDDLDAGIVYVTDVRAAGDTVEGIEVPAAVNQVNRYPVAVLSTASDAALAQAWVAFITDGPGHASLTKAGFGTP